MVHHFPNFVCWREIFSAYNRDRDLIYIDSILCFLVGILVGRVGNYFSGPQMAHRLFNESSDQRYFLLAENIEKISVDKKLILPFRSSFEGDLEILSFLEKLPHGSTLVIGVSSPKQNILANYLHSLRPDLRYFCLGAAVHITWDMKHANTKLRGSGFQWIEFLIVHPKRTIGKIATSVLETFVILSSWKSITLFRRFVMESKHSK